MAEIRPCERQCPRCKIFKHHSRFRHWLMRNSTVSPPPLRFHSVCRDCEQKERNEKKNQDRPLAIIRQRAATAAMKADTSTEFFFTQMNYRALVPVLRAMLSPEGVC